MRIDFLGLHAFVAIAERGSFQLAAAHLNLSQTALSHRIRKLEDDLGVKLLARTTREITITPAGLSLLPRVKSMIDELTVSLEDLRELGRIRQERLAIACLPTITAGLLPGVLAIFRDRHPDVMLRIHDNSATEIAELVHEGAVEFAISLISAHRWDFDIQALARDPFVLVCHESTSFGEARGVSWADIAGFPLVRVSTLTGNRMMIDDALGSRRESLKWAYEVQHISSAVAIVRAGLAMTVIPRLSLNAAGMVGLRVLEIWNPGVTRQIGIISKRSAPLSPLASELKDMVACALTNRPEPSATRQEKADISNHA